LILLLLLFIGHTRPAGAAAPSLPQSPVIKSISFDASPVISLAQGSDIWVNTWADDDKLYTSYGDGTGFGSGTKLSLGLAVISGIPPTISGANISSSTGQQTGDGPNGKKASGMLMVNGVIYMLVRNADQNGNQCQLAWSADHAKTWTWSSWKIAELGYCAFLNYGKNYSGARDGYVYAFFSNGPNAYNETSDVVLARVPKEKITDRASYEFFSGSISSPAWSAAIGSRKSVLNYPKGINRIDVTYNAPLKRYLMTNRSRAKAGGENQFTIFDAPEPWGPWSLVYYELQTSTSNLQWGESQHIPSKWISGNGKTIYVIYAGNDTLKVKKAVLQTDGNPPITSTVAPTVVTPPLTLKPGDANKDGKVDGLDYVVWLNNYNKTVTAGASVGDFDKNSKVDGLDYVIWLNNYNS